MLLSRTSYAVLFLAAFSFVFISCKKPDEATQNKNYSIEQLEDEICSIPNQCVDLNDNQVVFIDKGWAFIYDKAARTKTYVNNTSDIVEIVPYRGTVAALVHGGNIYIAGKDMQWVFVGNEALHIAAQGDDLLAIVGANGNLRRYKGTPGTLICYNQIILVGKSMIMIPTCNGRRPALEDTGITQIRAFSQRNNGELLLKKENGDFTPYEK